MTNQREPNDLTVRYGPYEIRAEHDEQYVSVPGVFLFSPPMDVPVRTRTVTVWGRKRIEEWTENGKQMGRWRWATAREEAELTRREENERMFARA